jgi:hypothetical protein
MLVHGGEIAIPPESYVWAAVARGFSRWRYSSWEAAVPRIVNAFKASDFAFSEPDFEEIRQKALDLPQHRRSLASALDLIYEKYCELNGFLGRRWGDKTPLNILDIRVIESIFPIAQYVHIVRDPRAVALSTVKASGISSRIRERNFAEAADRWHRSIRNARALQKRVGRESYYELKYEDLIRHPEAELARLCQYLDQSYSPAMLSFFEGATKLSDVVAQAHHAQVLRPLDVSRLDAWAGEISREDQKLVELMTAKYGKQLGYF